MCVFDPALITPFLTTLTLISTIVMFRNDKSTAEQKELNAKLFMIQNLAFEKSFLEDVNFTNNWSVIRNNSNDERRLQYDCYCEMVFNHLEQCYAFWGSEKNMLKHCNYKAWVRTHKLWWKDPLEEHSNGDGYPKNFRDLMDDWIK